MITLYSLFTIIIFANHSVLHFSSFRNYPDKKNIFKARLSEQRLQHTSREKYRLLIVSVNYISRKLALKLIATVETKQAATFPRIVPSKGLD